MQRKPSKRTFKQVKDFIFPMVLILMFAKSLYAQNDYQLGYVILNTRDTLHGRIKDRNTNNSQLFEKIKFKGEKGKLTRYSAQDLLGYKAGYSSYESLWYAEESDFLRFYYHSGPGIGEKKFLKVLVKGTLSCYAVEFFQDDNGYPDQFELFKRDGDPYFERATQGLFGLKKKKLAAYFKDCPVLAQKILDREITRPLMVVDYYNDFCEIP